MAVEPAEDRTESPAENSAPGAGRAYTRRIFRALLDVIELEAQIITLRLLAALTDVLLRTVLLAGAIAMALAGVVFLEIAIFQALDKLVPVLWVFVIFAIGHLALAGGLVLIASRPVREKSSEGSVAGSHAAERLKR